MGDDTEGTDLARDLIESMVTMPSPRLGPKKDAKKRSLPSRKAGEMEPLGEVVTDLAGQFGWQLSFPAIQARWPEIAGDVNAQHSKPERLSDKVLTVRTDSSTWAAALRLIAPQLVAKLNEALGDGSITSVEIAPPKGPTWKHGPKSVRDGRGPRDTYG
ncbi:MAG: DciA family protein [Propionibacteriaceae bacterium]|nr:DciA family protein [Propionibacteriaceae bacterium]